jgi:hypothetical protein
MDGYTCFKKIGKCCECLSPVYQDIAQEPPELAFTCNCCDLYYLGTEEEIDDALNFFYIPLPRKANAVEPATEQGIDSRIEQKGMDSGKEI